IGRRARRSDRSAKTFALRDDDYKGARAFPASAGARAFSTSARGEPGRATVDAPKRLRREGGQASGLRRIVQGQWPLVAGAIGLAVVNIATLILSGRPWGVTGAFALWGAKA